MSNCSHPRVVTARNVRAKLVGGKLQTGVRISGGSNWEFRPVRNFPTEPFRYIKWCRKCDKVLSHERRVQEEYV